jgi:hypothetical protein
MRRGSGSSDDGSIDRSMTIALRQKKKNAKRIFRFQEKAERGERRETVVSAVKTATRRSAVARRFKRGWNRARLKPF